jgi:hypothetical protein
MYVIANKKVMKKGLSEINLDSREEEKKNEFGANLLEMT